MDYFPIALEIKNRVAVVVGGGNIAERKARSLLEAHAHVRVIAPQASAGVRDLNGAGEVEWIQREVRDSDIDGARLVVAATNDPIVNKNVSKWARDKGVQVNVVDNPELCDYISPAVMRFDQAIIAVYTDGRDPGLSRDLKRYLKEKWDDFLFFRDRFQDRDTGSTREGA